MRSGVPVNLYGQRIEFHVIFHSTKYFDIFFKHLKNLKATLCSWVVQKRAVVSMGKTEQSIQGISLLLCTTAYGPTVLNRKVVFFCFFFLMK